MRFDGSDFILKSRGSFPDDIPRDSRRGVYRQFEEIYPGLGPPVGAQVYPFLLVPPSSPPRRVCMPSNRMFFNSLPAIVSIVKLAMQACKAHGIWGKREESAADCLLRPFDTKLEIYNISPSDYYIVYKFRFFEEE